MPPHIPQQPVVNRYDRLHIEFEGPDAIDAVVFTGPDGGQRTRPVFLHQPATFSYDVHGY